MNNSETILWRYYSYEAFLHFILTRTLFFCSPLSFFDKNDGLKNSKLNLENLQNLSELVNSGFGRFPEEAVKREQERHLKDIEYRKKVFISCWSYEEHESAALWNMYTNHGAGIAVKTKLGKVLNSISEKARSIIKHSEVSYKKPIDLTDDGPDSYLFKKEPPFSFEKEYRFLIDANNTEVNSFSKNELILDKYGIYLPVETGAFADAFIYGYSLPDWKIKSLQLLLDMSKIQVPLFKSSINWEPSL